MTIRFHNKKARLHININIKTDPDTLERESKVMRIRNLSIENSRFSNVPCNCF
jgi:hypothetical protein